MIPIWATVAAANACGMPWISRLDLHKPAVPDPQPGGSQHPVDRFVAAYLMKHDGQRGGAILAPVSDQTFARRVYLDVWGLLPLPSQLTEFVNRKDPDKRARLIASSRSWAAGWPLARSAAWAAIL